MADSDGKTPLHKVKCGDDRLMSSFENYSSTNGDPEHLSGFENHGSTKGGLKTLVGRSVQFMESKRQYELSNS